MCNSLTSTRRYSSLVVSSSTFLPLQRTAASLALPSPSYSTRCPLLALHRLVGHQAERVEGERAVHGSAGTTSHRRPRSSTSEQRYLAPAGHLWLDPQTRTWGGAQSKMEAVQTFHGLFVSKRHWEKEGSRYRPHRALLSRLSFPPLCSLWAFSVDLNISSFL